MILFNGNITPKNIRKQVKRASCTAGWACIAVCVLIALIYLVLFLVDICDLDDIKYLAGSFIFAISMGLLLILAPVSHANDMKGRGVSIEIDETRVRCNRPYHALPFVEISVNEVKRVLDYGECYYLIYTGMNQAIICQKDLLKQGSLEEFEALFQGKIKRKCKKQ